MEVKFNPRPNIEFRDRVLILLFDIIDREENFPLISTIDNRIDRFTLRINDFHPNRILQILSPVKIKASATNYEEQK